MKAKIETDPDTIRAMSENLDAMGVQYRLQATVARPLMEAWNKELAADIPADEFLQGCAGFVATVIANLSRSYVSEHRRGVVDFLMERVGESLGALDLAALPDNDADIDGIPVRLDG